MLVKTVANPTFTTIASVAYNPYNDSAPAGDSEITLTDSTGTLASEVTAIQFSIKPTGSTTGFHDGGTLYSELDVIGTPTSATSPTVPEPASIGLLGAGAAGLLGRRRRA